MLVVFFHNFGFANYFYFGWLGVDLFFVLSGFLITEILLKTVGQKNYFRNFYLKRVLRIFPLYYLVLIVSLLILPRIPSLQDNLHYYVENQVWLWTYLQNWLFITKEPESTNFLVHLWSLAVEEQFYLLWPCVILWIRKPKTLLVLVSISLILVICLRIWLWLTHTEVLNYFNPYTFTRVDGICIGCMLALVKAINFDIIKRYSTLMVLTLSVLNFIFYFLNKNYSFSFPYFPFFGYTSFAIVFAFLIHEAVTKKNKVINSVFNLHFLKFFGKISYGFYIFHWPIYLGLFPAISLLLSKKLKWHIQEAQMISAIIVTLAAVLVSVISYYTFEMKFLKLKNRL